MTMDSNDRARELLTLGLTPKQCLKVRLGGLLGSNNENDKPTQGLERLTGTVAGDGLGIRATRDIIPKEDIFVESLDWVSEQMWGAPDDISDTQLSGSCEWPAFPFYNIENETLSQLRHSDASNILLIKLPWLKKSVLLVPKRSIAKGEEITRDWAWGCPRGSKKRSGLLMALGVNFASEAEATVHSSLVSKVKRENLLQGSTLVLDVPSIVAPVASKSESSPLGVSVFSDDSVVLGYLKSSPNGRFVLEPDPSKARFWYTIKPIQFQAKNKDSLISQLKGVNQFPFESALVRKDVCLVQVCRACLKRFPDANEWVLPAFDLETELVHFVEYFHNNTAGNKLWAIKPAQQARSSGVTVTGSLNVILASLNAPGGDKVAQAYIERPFLLGGKRKFDLRTVVIVHQFKPLIAWANLEATYARIAAEDFDTSSLYRKRSHMTVSRYDALSPSDNNEFPPVMSRQHLLETLSKQKNQWMNTIEPRALAMIRMILQAGGHFIGSNRRPPSQGACYGIDWMVDESGHPKLIEVNFCPDLTGACTYDKNLVGDLLACLTNEGSSIPSIGRQWIPLQ